MVYVKLVPDYARFVIHANSKLAIFSKFIRFANNANGHICRICTRRFNIRVNSLV